MTAPDRDLARKGNTVSRWTLRSAGRAAFDPPEATNSGDGWSDRLGLLGVRVARAWIDETSFDTRRVVGRTISHVLPQFSFNRTRTAVLRATGVRIGTGSRIMGPLDVTGSGDMRELFSIGDATFISCPLHVDLGAAVRIGHRVQLGHNVVLLTIDHRIGPPEDRCGRQVAAPIDIGDGAWIASRVTILPGVSIGCGAVVAAGAVVSRDVAPNTLVAGVPARFVRALDVGEAPAPIVGLRESQRQ
jgi:maltose O-acetyltransferase